MAGGAVLGAFAVVNILRVMKFRIYGHRLFTAFFECACLFVVWKHGHNRAGHEVMFWEFIIPAAPLLFMAHEAPMSEEPDSFVASPGPAGEGLMHTSVSMHQLAGVPVVFVVVCAFLAARVESDDPDFAGYANPLAALVKPLERMASNVEGMVNWPARLSVLKSSLEENRADAALPEVKKVVGNDTIDMFGFLPGLVLLNDLNYHPRPVPINFAATTPLLMEKNAAFYRDDATAPKFLLANIGQIVARFPPQDDALALPEVFEHYTPLLSDHGFLLLQRTPGQPDLERIFISSTNVEWGEHTSAGDWHKPALVFSGHKVLSDGAGALISLSTAAVVHCAGVPGRHLGPTRMLQSGAGMGFLLRPLILNDVDFLAVYGRRAESTSTLTPQFDNLRFVINREDEAFFEPDIKVSFWSIGPKK